MSKRKASWAEGVVKEKPKSRGRGCKLNLLLQKWKRSQNRQQKRINLQTKKVRTKGKRGGKGKHAEVANQETKDFPAENGETKNKERPASDEAGEKEAKSD